LVVGGPRARAGGELWFGQAGWPGGMSRRPSEQMLTIAAAVPAEVAFEGKPAG
jgi:hypothetical protein